MRLDITFIYQFIYEIFLYWSFVYKKMNNLDALKMDKSIY